MSALAVLPGFVLAVVAWLHTWRRMYRLNQALCKLVDGWEADAHWCDQQTDHLANRTDTEKSFFASTRGTLNQCAGQLEEVRKKR